MKAFLSRTSVVALALAAAGAWLPQTASATTAPRGFPECMDIAVDNGADVWIAHEACTSDSLTACYRVFRDEYGRQQWALDACKARNA
jgi:hypothetical protein